MPESHHRAGLSDALLMSCLKTVCYLNHIYELEKD
jgi:hypothetical protein